MPKFRKIALIIGAMKSGTTSLYADLARHPAIASSFNKETKFFSSDERFARGEDWYYSRYDIGPAHEWVIDGTTDCAKFPYCGDVPARLQAYGADVKLIYIMRHPVRRLESHARHAARTGCEVNDIRSDRRDHSLDAGLSHVARAVSNYAMQIDQFRDWFDRREMLLLTTEEYHVDPAAVRDRIIGFLGLQPMPGMPPLTERRNRGDGFIRHRKVAAFVRDIPVVGPALRRVLPRSVQELGWERAVVPGRFRFTAAEEQALISEMRPDLDRLRDDYGVDIARWWRL